MAASAGTKSPWSVFAGAATALVLSTLAAVVAGSFLQRLIPQHYIKGVAAILFLIFGILLFISALQSRKEHVSAKTTEFVASKGILAKVALSAAAEFERGAVEDYIRLAHQTENTLLRQLFEHLAEEEQHHLNRVIHIADRKDISGVEPVTESEPTKKRSHTTDKTVVSILDSAINHEKSTSRFYKALAKSTVISELRMIFTILAGEEDSHVAHLEEFKLTGSTDTNQQHPS